VTTWTWVTRQATGAGTHRVPPPAGSVAFVNGGTAADLWGIMRPADSGAGQQAARQFLMLARAAVAAVPDGHRVTVSGDGMLAYLLRRMLPEFTRTGSAGPVAVIETTGLPASIREATAKLPRLGHLVLAVPPRDAETDLATYADLHVRGLTISAADEASAPAAAGEDEAVVAEALQLLVSVTPGMAIPGGALWYAMYAEVPE
jgi:hypothetical protein